MPKPLSPVVAVSVQTHERPIPQFPFIRQSVTTRLNATGEAGWLGGQFASARLKTAFWAYTSIAARRARQTS